MTKSTIDPFPIRLIYKMGDDLRQDMITLKMLSLFDKVGYSYYSNYDYSLTKIKSAMEGRRIRYEVNSLWLHGY